MSDSETQVTKISGNNNNVANNIIHVQDDKRPRVLLRITEFDGRFTDLPEVAQKKKITILIVESVIEDEIDAIGATKTIDILTDLTDGNFSKADKIFAEIQEREDPSGKRGGRIAFARGKIAEQQNRLHDATRYYSHAAGDYPCFETLIAAQNFCIRMSAYDSALAFSAKAKTFVSADYGDTSEQYAAILKNLADIYCALEKYEKATSIYLQVLDICDYHLGGESSLIGAVNHSFGLLYYSQEQYQRAESYFNEAIKIFQNELGESHPDIATKLNNLAGFYKEQRQFDKAESLFLQALKILETNFGSDYPDTKTVKANYEETKKDRLESATTP